MEEISKSGRGGARAGAGRPRLKVTRAIRQMRAFQEEWELIQAFARIVKCDPERAKRILQTE